MNQSLDTSLLSNKDENKKIGHSLGTPIGNWLVTSFKRGQIFQNKNLPSIKLLIENIFSTTRNIFNETLQANSIASISAYKFTLTYLHELTAQSNHIALDYSLIKGKNSNNRKGNFLDLFTWSKNFCWNILAKGIRSNTSVLTNAEVQDKTVLG